MNDKRSTADLRVPTITPTISESVYASDGTELTGYRYPGSGLPVVLVHGFGSSAESNWVRTGWIRDLTTAGRDVIAVDLRGHGRSGHPTDPGAYRLRALVNDLSVVLAAIAPEHSVFDGVGYSLGARVIAEFAAVTGQIRRLVLGGSDGRPLYEDVDIPQVVAALLAGGEAESAPAARVVQIARALPSSNPEALGALACGLAEQDHQAGTRTPDPSVPVLIAGGALDEMFTGAKDWVHRINSGHPGRAEYLAVPSRGHVNVVPSNLFRAGAIEFLGRG